jgi:hypothetical protein
MKIEKAYRYDAVLLPGQSGPREFSYTRSVAKIVAGGPFGVSGRKKYFEKY